MGNQGRRPTARMGSLGGAAIFLPQLGDLGSVVSSPSGVLGEALTANALKA